MNKSAVTAVPAPQEPAVEDFAGDALAGLSAQPKTLPSKYLYDTRGSELFEAICEQPEYYPTRTELSILQDEAASMAEAVGPRALVVEYGSGSGIKTQRLLDALPDPVAYVPIEISHSALNASVAELATQFPEIEMLPLCADFLQPVRLPASERPAERVLIFFPGSTLGNFDTDAAVRLLTTMRTEMGDNGAALIGIDLKKDPAMIEAAYNDAAGVTADFTLNLLDRMNRELDADFDRERFTHRARYKRHRGPYRDAHRQRLCADGAGCGPAHRIHRRRGHSGRVQLQVLTVGFCSHGPSCRTRGDTQLDPMPTVASRCNWWSRCRNSPPWRPMQATH